MVFLVRHDKPMVSRLRTFLSWKDARNKFKDEDPDDEEAIEEPSTGELIWFQFPCSLALAFRVWSLLL